MGTETVDRTGRAEPLLQAAERLYLKRGRRLVPLAEVARETGLHEQEVYNYVGSEESLYLACHRRARAALQQTLDEIVAEGTPDPPRLLRCIQEILEFTAEHREGYAELAARSSQCSARLAAELEDSRRETVLLISQLLTEARVAIGADPGLVNTQTTAAALYGAVQSVAEWSMARPEIPTDQIALMMASVLWLGVSGTLGVPTRSEHAAETAAAQA